MGMTKDQIVGRDDADVKEIKIKSWDGAEVFIRTMTQGDRKYLFDTKKEGSDGDIPARVAAVVLCDGEGNRLFADGEWKELLNKKAGAIDEICEAGMKHSGMGDDAIKELEENSEKT